MILKRFSEVLGAKHGRQNRFLDHFLRCFFRMRFGIDFSSISGDSDLEKSTKTIVFPMVFVIFTKSTFSKHIRKYGDAGFVFGSQNDEKARTNYVEKRFF